MQKRDGEFRSEKIVKGGVIYAPMDWSGHRTVNTGKDNLVFFTVELAETGHDYKIVRKDGFAKLVVERKGKPRIINNPKYRP